MLAGFWVCCWWILFPMGLFTRMGLLIRVFIWSGLLVLLLLILFMFRFGVCFCHWWFLGCIHARSIISPGRFDCVRHGLIGWIMVADWASLCHMVIPVIQSPDFLEAGIGDFVAVRRLLSGGHCCRFTCLASWLVPSYPYGSALGRHLVPHLLNFECWIGTFGLNPVFIFCWWCLPAWTLFFMLLLICHVCWVATVVGTWFWLTCNYGWAAAAGPSPWSYFTYCNLCFHLPNLGLWG